ncbi:flavin-dependent oxidoreductase FOX5-like [Gossypium australe]|uniref:Flavin-dependent oxidoreductase FOX5-like n=1 Tax=Gossypium australe TaxID=47621 RepID=A0A5B6WW26_9ROSI|nr:flavin-dependent oxidoreductase FOX5-like [Gossypium australe]
MMTLATMMAPCLPCQSLINLGNNNFRTTLTGQNEVEWLSPAIPTIIKEAKLTVEEPVLTGDIYDAKYDLGSTMKQPSLLPRIPKNPPIWTRSFHIQISRLVLRRVIFAQVAMEAKMEFNAPLISYGNIVMSCEFHSCHVGKDQRIENFSR